MFGSDGGELSLGVLTGAGAASPLGVWAVPAGVAAEGFASVAVSVVAPCSSSGVSLVIVGVPDVVAATD